MNFKEWLLLSESIVIQDGIGESTLHVVEPHFIKEFNYQTDTEWSTYFIAPYQARRVGYVSISQRPTHVGITKTNPIEAGKGVDISFIKTLAPLLQSKAGKPVPYKEGESDWSNIVKNIKSDEFEPEKQDLLNKFKNAQDTQHKVSAVPDIKAGASNAQKITTGISVSKASGSWSYFFRNEHPQHAIDGVLDMMKQAAKPLIDNDLMEFYEIRDRMSGRTIETVHSKTGHEAKDKWQNEYNNNVAYLKFLADTMLKGYPNAHEMVMHRINGVGTTVSGGRKHPALDIKPANTRVPLNDVSKFIKASYADDEILHFFIRAVSKDNKYLYDIMNKAAADKTNRGSVIFYIAKFLDDNVNDVIENIREQSYYDAINIFKHSAALESLIPSQFNKFKQEYTQELNSYLENPGEPLEKHAVTNIKELSKYLQIDPRIMAHIDDAHAQHTKADEDRKEAARQKTENNKFIIGELAWKYLVLKDGMKTWEDVPDKYVSYRGDSIDEEDFISNEIVDFDEVHDDAYEAAMEKAQGNVESKPSESYGEDKEEVMNDIGYDMDDFASDESLDVPDDISNEDLEQLIKTKYYNEYVEWKIKQLKQEEEEESWKYEAEPDNEDIYAAASEISVGVAYDEKGLVILHSDEHNNVSVEYNSKFESEMMPILKKAIQTSVRTKDPEFQEPMMKIHAKIVLEPRDKTANKNFTAYQLSQTV
jgi:hypothetical protein